MIKMEFCDSCGILLPSPSYDAVPYCRPCKGLNQMNPSVGATQQNKEEVNTVNPPSVEENGRNQPSMEGPRQNLVAESVRGQWEIEQADYKRQLVEQDTPDITTLLSGQRRKNDGTHFYVGGVDISFIKGDEVNACACLTVVRIPDLEMVYQRMGMIKLTQPYIPGFLAFREVPPLEELFNHLMKDAPFYCPDVILVDGNGKLHPRAFGLACQLGVILDIPTAGVAKSLMSAQGIVDDSNHKRKKHDLKEAGDGFDLVSDSGNVLGRCVRVHDNAPNPVYISVGHKMTLDSAVWIVLECSKFRIPEPLRRSDLDSREYLRKKKTEPEEFVKDRN